METKKVGYSFWGFLADIKMDKDLRILSTPDGNAFYSWSIIKELQSREYTVINVMPDRDYPAVDNFTNFAFSSFAMEDRYNAYIVIDTENVKKASVLEQIIDECVNEIAASDVNVFIENGYTDDNGRFYHNDYSEGSRPCLINVYLLEKDIDIKKNNGKTLTYTYSINISDVDAICYRFDAHGSLSDKYWLRNIRFNAKFH